MQKRLHVKHDKRNVNCNTWSSLVTFLRVFRFMFHVSSLTSVFPDARHFDSFLPCRRLPCRPSSGTVMNPCALGRCRIMMELPTDCRSKTAVPSVVLLQP